QRSRAGLAQRASTGDGGRERERIGEVCDDLAVVGDRRGHDCASEPTGAEVERAAGRDRRGAGRVDHPAVGNRQRADQRATAAAAFRTEPAPVTVTVEAPVTSPMNIGAVALTVPPLATVSTPGPSVLQPRTQ